MNLKIDPEYESRIPPLSVDEFNQLEENILADGVINSPILIWNGVIIDGHNRYRIAEKHPHIKFTTTERQFNNRHEALAWICKNQLGRRNLTFQQKKYLIGKQYEAEKASHGGDRKSSEVKSSGQNDQMIFDQTTARRIADENGIGEKTVRRAAHYSRAVDLADEVEPGIRKEILSGAIKATDKEIHALARADPEERPALVEELRKPQKERRSVLPERNLLTLEQIAAEMPDENYRVTPEGMLDELEDALDTFIFRWSVCLSHNCDYFSESKYRTKINRLVQNGLDYLNEILKGEIPL